MVQSEIWSVANAKARLSEMLDRAKVEPQFITRNGKPAAVVVSTEEWQLRTRRRDSLAEFLLKSPLRGVDLDLERMRDEPHELDLCEFSSTPMSCRSLYGRSRTRA